MHIPAAPTGELSILPFRQALETSGLRGDFDADRWLYVPDFYTEYRYILGTRGEDPLICIGVNPSTAAPDALDNTLKSVQRIADFNGFDSFIMFNVYAQRRHPPGGYGPGAKSPPAPGKHGCLRLHTRLQPAARPLRLAAWGNIIQSRPYLPGCVADMIALGESFGARWYTAGPRSRKGHPHHPLYLRKDSPLEPFDVAAYCAGL